MTLYVPYLVYGYIYDGDGSTPLIGATVTATDLTNGGSTSDTTDSSGKYTVDLSNISTCEDGDSIKISVTHNLRIGSSTFTLDISSGFKQIDITTTAGRIDHEGETLRIYYSGNAYPNFYIDCWCTRWDESNWDVVVETFLSSGARDILFKNVAPGAVRELSNILGKPKYIDTTYHSGNTLILSPISTYPLSSIVNERRIAVKNISDAFLTPNKFSIKIEGKRLDT